MGQDLFNPMYPAIRLKGPRKIYVDCIWQEFGSIDVDGLSEREDAENPCISITRNTLYSTEGGRELQGHDDQKWDAWRKSDVPSIEADPAQPQNSFSFLMCPRRVLKEYPNLPDRVALSSVPMPTARFKDVMNNLHIPNIFIDIIMRPRAVFKHIRSSVNDQPCEAFILCVDSVLKNHTAVCITYFPKSKQIYGLYLGYVNRDDVSDMTSRLIKNKEFANHPFVLIAAFLQIERKHRFVEINAMIDESYERLRAAEEKTQGEGPWSLEGGGLKHHVSHNFSLKIGTLRTHLRMWMIQLDKVVAVCDEFPEFTPKGTGGFLLRPREYVTNMLESFEEGIMRCDNILQIMSLAFQKELADTARKDSSVAISDARQMKAIALLTMFFLPTAAVAGFMDAPIYDWGETGKYWFWPITAVITGSVLIIYFWWVRRHGRVVGRIL